MRAEPRSVVERLEPRRVLSGVGCTSAGGAITGDGGAVPVLTASLTRRTPAAPPDISQHTYEGTAKVQRQKLTIVIDPFPSATGTVSGTVTIGAAGQFDSFHFSGTISSNRHFVMNFDDGSGSITGTVTKNASKLSGSYKRTVGGVLPKGSFTAPAV